MIIASASASAKLGSVEVAQVALSGDYGISSLLTRVAGTARARELMFTSRPVDAASFAPQ
jgi:enoyl-CoA hydratase/carnithine racemase